MTTVFMLFAIIIPLLAVGVGIYILIEVVACRIAHRKIRIRAQHIVLGIVFAIFSLYALFMLFSFFFLVTTSLKTSLFYEKNLGQGFMLPDKLDFSNYLFAFKEFSFNETGFFGMIGNSLWYTVISIAAPLFMNTCVGYAVSKYKFKARGIYYGVIVFCMTIPIIGTTGATMQLYSDLGLYDKGPLLHFITHLGAGGMSFLVMYAYFKNISWEYAEAALMDGAGHFTVFFKIMIPMAVPAMGALALLSGIGAWNSYMDVLMFNPSWPTLASGLYGISRTLPRYGNTPAYYAALVIAFIPILVIFCIFSDKIMKNFSVGGLKE